MSYEHQVGSPVGELVILASDRAIRGVYFRRDRGGPRGARDGAQVPVVVEVARQLAEYFAGERFDFDVPTEVEGTAHERAVWQALGRIPYGHTESYGGLARRLDRPGAARAIGRANARNPLAVIVPCHRVIGADGSLTGYAGGVDLKRWLLAHEARHAPARARAARPALATDS